MSDEAEKEAPKKGSPIVMIVLVVVSAALGAAVPMLMGGDAEANVVEEPVHEELKEMPEPAGKIAFLEFGETVGNLVDGRMTRFLRINITLQVDEAQLLKITELVDSKKAILRNWLLSQISDKSMDDIKGAAGQNRLRREIFAHFNTVLFPDGKDRVQDVLFEDFNVQ